ncbi:unnamed protein product [Caenorhabditis auriculariae]|uniref:C2H2-type domain-containing protein n=1 Tax=Caenorhabditis auriculariae TaxID=2777116 RepID=A0A8S1HE48_9PELO|nr:unnamed protein product [Caenorhabditis auriculariae]
MEEKNASTSSATTSEAPSKSEPELTVENEEELQVDEVDGEVVLEENEGFGFEYDSSFHVMQEQNMLYELYQPEETPQGTFLCRICLRLGRENEFPDRVAFTTHRYKSHGSFNNTILCPVQDCRETFAAMASLRRHLTMNHNAPIEVHQKMFANIGEFEKWRHLVEMSSQSRFMLHSKQPKHRRQVMHCACSEHKLVLQSSKHRLPRLRMQKEGACCPAQISFRIEAKTGQVQCFCQLYHIGHIENNETKSEKTDRYSHMICRPIGAHFPMKPEFYGDRALQFIQIDIVGIEATVYGNAVYENFLMVVDLKTKFLWGRALTDPSRTVLIRLLSEIFFQFGVPQGFSCSMSTTLIREAMRAIETVFSVEIREVWNEPPKYDEIEQGLLQSASSELGSPHRWVEMLPFSIMEINHRAINGKSPFERMFNRKPLGVSEEKEPSPRGAVDQEKSRKNVGFLDPEDLGAELGYSVGERVYLRQGTKKPGRGNNLPFIYGYIAEVDRHSPHYPYKVHHSQSEDPWPSEANVYAWASSYDILPTTHSVKAINEKERQEIMRSLLCSCDQARGDHGEKARAPCELFRNTFCDNRMSRVCCEMFGGKQCYYHSLYPVFDDSYQRLETMYSIYQSKLKEARTKRSEARPDGNVSISQKRETSKPRTVAPTEGSTPAIKRVADTKIMGPPKKSTTSVPTQAKKTDSTITTDSEECQKSPIVPTSRRSSRKPVKSKVFDESTYCA